MKPTVLFVHSNSELYGADFILLEVVRAIKNRLRPIVAVPGPGELAALLLKEGVRVVYTRESLLRRVHFKPTKLAGFAWNVIRDVKMLVDIIREENVGLVYSNTGAVITGALAARIAGIKNLYHIHEIIIKPRWLSRAIARLVLGNSNEVIVVSGPVRDQLLVHGKAGDPPIRIIHNGLDATRFDNFSNIESVRTELGAGPENVLVGVIGRIHPWKGQQYFAEAAKLVADACPEARFVIVGGTFSGYEYLVDELDEKIRKLGLQDKVKVLSHRKDVPSLMRALDIFVLPSTLPDPLPTVVLESMSAARPVVATAHGGALEMVVHGETGLLAPYHDARGFADAIIELASNKDMRLRFGEAGRQRIESEFSRERFHRDIGQCIADHFPEQEAKLTENLVTS